MAKCNQLTPLPFKGLICRRSSEISVVRCIQVPRLSVRQLNLPLNDVRT